MKKMISTLGIALCFLSYSHAQVIDSSHLRKPGHNRQSQDTMHSTKKNNRTDKNRNNNRGTDSSMNGQKPMNRRTDQQKMPTDTAQ